MKSYSIRQEAQQSIPDESIAGKKDIPVKKWKTFLAVLVLIAAAFLIIKLQQLESGKPVLQTVNKSKPAKTPVKSKEAVIKKEPVNPTNYLKIKMNWHKNLLGETVLEGTLHNTAPLANFTDPVLLITWLSKTNTIMGTNRHPINQYLGAGNSIRYKLKLKAPGKIGDVKISVESARTVQ